MQRAFDQFKDNIVFVKELDALYVHLSETLKLPNDLSDLLRAQLVYAVSALDKLIHELVRLGMIEAFQGRRTRTKKFLAFSVSVETHTFITSSSSTSIPPPEFWFEQEVNQKNKTSSFQEPEKIADALSLIWDEDYKWQYIAKSMKMKEGDLKKQLKTIIARRNQIVHEADLDLITGNRNTIDKGDISNVVPFIENLSECIFNAVK